MARLTRESVGARFAYQLGERSREKAAGRISQPFQAYFTSGLICDGPTILIAYSRRELERVSLACRLHRAWPCVFWLAIHPLPVRLFPASLCVILYLFTSPFSAFISHADRHPFIVFTLLSFLIIGGLTCASIPVATPVARSFPCL